MSGFFWSQLSVTNNLITTLTNPARRTDTMRARNIIIIIVVVNVAWGGFYVHTQVAKATWLK